MNQKEKKKQGDMVEEYFFRWMKDGGTAIKEIKGYWDYEVNGVPVEVKGSQLCVRRKRSRNGKPRYNMTGFTIGKEAHDKLKEKNGYYCLNLLLAKEILKTILIPANDIEEHMMCVGLPRGKPRLTFSVFYSKKAITLDQFVSFNNYDEEKQNIMIEEDLEKKEEEKREFLRSLV